MTDSQFTATVTPLTLSSIACSTPCLFPASAVLRGLVVSVRPYSHHTKLGHVVLSPASSDEDQSTRLEIEMKGWWAEKASARFRQGEVVILRAAGGKLLEGSSKGKEKEGNAGRKRLRFEKGLQGWVLRKGGQQELLRYKATDPRPFSSAMPPAAPIVPSRKPAGGPPGKPVVQPTLATATTSAAPPAPPPTTAPVQPEKTALSTKRPRQSTPPLPPEPREETPSTAKNSAPGEGFRSRKRRRKEEQLGWGLSTSAGTFYTAFSDLPGVLAAPARSGPTAKKLVNILALVSDPGEACAPRKPDGDWYRRLTLTCPSRPTSPVEVQWYAKTAEALPQISYGDLLLAEGLILRGSSLSPTLMAGSYDPVPHAVLSPSHLLAPSGPTQHPTPAPPAPDRPPTIPLHDWRRTLMLSPIGVGLDEEELAHAVRVARYFRRESVAATAGATVSPDTYSTKASATADQYEVKQTGMASRAVTPATAAFKGSRPLVRISELEEGKFCDVVGMVTNLSTHSPFPLSSLPSNHSADLFITDYTSHPLLKPYDSPTSTSPGVGLAGKLTLRISLFGYQVEPLIPFVNPQGTGGIKRGLMVHLRNLRIKRDQEGGWLEATLVEEMEERWRWKRDLMVLQSSRRGKGLEESWRVAAKGVQARHREYWAKQSQQ
ncbi:hypothetical protein JCM11641_007023 [Rhodosporidiobolus odoratus]